MALSLGWLSALIAGLFSAHVLQKLCFPNFWTDLFFLLKVVRYGMKLELFKLRTSVCTVLDRFIQQAQRIPNKPFVIYDGRIHTYWDIEERSNRLANVFLHTVNLRRGDCVALLMSNEPDFLCVWFGLAKVGCSVAFLNTNIKHKSLLHCFNCCGAKTLITGSDLVESLDGILSSLLEDNIQVWAMKSQSEHRHVHTLLDKIDAASDQPVPTRLRVCTSLKSPTLYIFTSGTTGLPKAAVITHLQSLKAAAGFWAFGATKDDVMYIPLPLYHSAASLIGIGGTIELGATCVLKKKFSASQFWNDCRKHDVTIFQYIGELCRYLCNQPKTEVDKVHKVRMGVGNGLRQDVWRDFQNRFGNIKMCEVYGSTEGNLCFMNHLGKIGTVGRSNFIYRLLFKYDLVKYDMMRDEPVKDQYGFCKRVKKGETGLLLSKVSAISPFFGYAGSKQLTEKKLMRNVFVKGDAYFNTGDLMAEDQEGFICFRDRLGDTFRWKGENVATTEVTETLGLVDFIQEVNVYGVEIPGHEGRAGMAAMIVRPGLTFDGRKLFEHVMRDLPAYARPLFIRLQEVMEMTSTLKQQKFQLVQSGFSPSTISDPLYVLDYQQEMYIPLTDSIYQSILTGERKL
ncbi:Long-chain fatty acid transport protein 6 [Larimichthys crocea]|uniref:long-chain-fatty-acid--CoA ligase n=2 Tax=Larimichthys crocea TaxID=215358 RepID=A0A6G0I046_LARCR|nr:long-chain fatty acid transport protein 6 [Larimichthys crocea]KAE8284707.1 Long-chain fatty acid transport protein 6 [Larimichthys crocea]TMS08038.1 Long-chain fatty acid transport protein 6 [Larimichthys crocea]